MSALQSPLRFLSHQVIHRDARVLFKAGKNRDGWFGSDQLLAQVDNAVDIFEGLTKGNAQGLFLFDNAPSHQKRAPDAISARHMPKSALLFLFPLTHLLTWRSIAHTQIQRQTGRLAPMGHTCATADFQLVKASHFTSPPTILRCQTGSRGWRLSFASAGCGQQAVCWHSAQTFTALLEELIAAAAGFFFCSLTSLTKRLIYRNLSNAAVTCVTFTPSTIVR